MRYFLVKKDGRVVMTGSFPANHPQIENLKKVADVFGGDLVEVSKGEYQKEEGAE
jgi:hypothetical protein